MECDIANWKKNEMKLLEINITNEMKNSVSEEKYVFEFKEKNLSGWI